MQEWADKLAKDDKTFVLVYHNNTPLTLYLIKDTLTEGKYDNPPSKDKKGKGLKYSLEPQSTLKFGIRGKKKDCELSHKWIEEDTGAASDSKAEFLLSLQVPPGQKARAAHLLSPEGVFPVKKIANWKVKPPQITVTLGDPSNTPKEEKENKDTKEAPPKETKEASGAKEEKKQKTKKKDVDSSEEEKKNTRQDTNSDGAKASKSKKLKKQSSEHKPEPKPETKVEAPPAGPTTTMNASSPMVIALKEQAGQQVQMGIACLDAGQFSNASVCFVQSVGLLVNSVGPEAYKMFHEEMMFAIRYAQASQFLLEMQRLQHEKLYKQLALVARLTADLSVQPNHRLTNVRIAINLNFQVGNFYTVGRFITLLKESGAPLPEQSLYEEMFKICEENGFKEHHVPAGVSNPQSVNFCFQTLRVIQGHPVDHCSFCLASYHPNLLPKCIYCNSSLVTQ